MSNNLKGRRGARRLLIQALYQWHISKPAVSELELQYFTDNDMSVMDGDYFREVLKRITTDFETLDLKFTPYLDRSLGSLDPIELAILRLGIFEMTERIDIPFRAVINEGVELAKEFGAESSHKYINGILHRAAKDFRKTEFQQ